MNMIKNIKNTTFLLAMLALSASAYAADSSKNLSVSSSEMTSVATKVNINTADATAISGRIKGIGQKRAEAIVHYRTEHGPFKSFDELAQVKGIGDSFVKTHLLMLQQTFTLS